MRGTGFALGFAVLAMSAARRRDGDLGDMLSDAALAIFSLIGIVLSLLSGWRLIGLHAPAKRRPTLAALLVCVGLGWALVDRGARGITGGALCVLLGASLTLPSARFLTASAVASIVFVCTDAVTLLIDRLALLQADPVLLRTPIRLILSAFGADEGEWDGGVVIRTMRGFRPLLITLGNSGAQTIAAVVIVFSCIAFSGRMLALRGMVFVLIGGLSMCLRFTLHALCTYLVDGRTPYETHGVLLDWAYSPYYGLLLDSLACTPLLVFASCYRQPRELSKTTTVKPLPVVLAGVSCLCLTVHSWADAQCMRTTAAVAIDEGHSGWEPTDLALGENYYGDESGYNFRAMTDWLAGHYGQVRRLYEPLTTELLDGLDVLIVKTPTAAYSHSEIEAIKAYVLQGGGLILIGDHTNVFGTSEVLNTIAAEVGGFVFEYDCLFDQRQRFEHIYSPESSVRCHPILRDVKRVRFEVGCSLKLNALSARPVIVGRALKSLPIDYSASNFYPAVRDESDMRIGQFTEVAVRVFGRGRVAALTDSTFLSTFSVCLPGRRELLLGMVDWVGRGDVGSSLRGWLVLLGAIGGGVAIVLCLARGVVTSAIAFSVGSGLYWTVGSLGLCFYESSPAQGVSKEIYFSTASSTVFWPVDQMVRDSSRSYSMFFQWVLRTGAFPRLVDSWRQASVTGVPLVLIEPSKEELLESDSILEFVRQGGRVLLLDSIEGSATSALWSKDDRSVGPKRQFDCVITSSARITLGGFYPLVSTLYGGRPLMWTKDGEVVAAEAHIGHGVLIVVTCGELFTDLSYGGRYDVWPDANRRMLFQFEFDQIRALTTPQGAQQ